MVIGYINGMEIYYHTLCGKGAPLGGYFVTYTPGPCWGAFLLSYSCTIRVQFVYILVASTVHICTYVRK